MACLLGSNVVQISTFVVVVLLLINSLNYNRENKSHFRQQQFLQSLTRTQSVSANVADGQIDDKDQIPTLSTTSNQLLTLTKTNQLKKFPFNRTLAIMVLSARNNFDRRNAIRKTWAYNEPNIYFIVGAKYCPWPSQFLKNPMGCELSVEYDLKMKNNSFEDLSEEETKIWRSYVEEQEEINKKLILETENENNKQNSDDADDISIGKSHLTINETISTPKNTYSSGKLIAIDLIDTYNNLTLKTKKGFDFLYKKTLLNNQKHPVQKYFMKIDDDCLLKVKQINRMINNWYPYDYRPDLSSAVLNNSTESIPNLLNNKGTRNYNQFLYFGRIQRGHKRVLKSGKWAEWKYKEPRYPLYADGNSGYVISYDLAKYLSNNQENLINYQNEDATLGIWLEESPIKNFIKYQSNKRYMRYIKDNERSMCRPQDHIEKRPQPLHAGAVVLGHKLNTVEEIEFCYKYVLGEMH